MDRRFFENDNIDDLLNNESPENFQKIDEEDDKYSLEIVLNSNDNYFELEEYNNLDYNIQEDENSDLGSYEVSNNLKYNYEDCDSNYDTSSDCNCGYCDSEEEYEYNCYESDDCSSSDNTSSCNNNCISTFDEDERCRENKEYYLKGKKEGYDSGYEAGARDAIRAAYIAGYKRGLRAARCRI